MVHQLRAQEAQVDHTAGVPRLVVVYVNEWSGDPVTRLLDQVGREVARVLGQAAGAGAIREAGETLATWTDRWHLELLVILDQFEEFFLYHPDEAGPGSLAAELPPAVDRADLPVSFLVAIREDALARLDRFKGRIPNLFENYIRIRHLGASGPRRHPRAAATAQPASPGPGAVDSRAGAGPPGAGGGPGWPGGAGGGRAGRGRRDDWAAGPPIETPTCRSC